MRKPAHAAPAAYPVQPIVHLPAAQRVLRRTARAWLPAALLRPKPSDLPPDERVRLSGEW